MGRYSTWKVLSSGRHAVFPSRLSSSSATSIEIGSDDARSPRVASVLTAPRAASRSAVGSHVESPSTIRSSRLSDGTRSRMAWSGSSETEAAFHSAAGMPRAAATVVAAAKPSRSAALKSSTGVSEGSTNTGMSFVPARTDAALRIWWCWERDRRSWFAASAWMTASDVLLPAP